MIVTISPIRKKNNLHPLAFTPKGFAFGCLVLTLLWLSWISAENNYATCYSSYESEYISSELACKELRWRIMPTP